MNILIELEREVKTQFAINPSGDQMYLAIKALTEKILVVRNLVSNREDIDQVAHDYAITLWLRVSKGVVISNWTKYIMLNLSSTLHNYYKSHNRSHIDATILDPVDQETFITTMYGSSNRNEYIRKFELEDYLTTLFQEVKNDVLKFSRTTNIVFNRKLYLSVLASLFNNDKSLVGLPDEYTAYVEFICKLVRRSLYYKSIDIINNHEFKSLANVLRLDQEAQNS